MHFPYIIPYISYYYHLATDELLVLQVVTADNIWILYVRTEGILPCIASNIDENKW